MIDPGPARTWRHHGSASTGPVGRLWEFTATGTSAAAAGVDPASSCRHLTAGSGVPSSPSPRHTDRHRRARLQRLGHKLTLHLARTSHAGARLPWCPPADKREHLLLPGSRRDDVVKCPSASVGVIECVHGLGDGTGIRGWLRGQDLNLRPSGYEPDELPGCSTPRGVPGGGRPPGGCARSGPLRGAAWDLGPPAGAAGGWRW